MQARPQPMEMTILGLKEELTMEALLPFLDFEIG